PALQYFRPALTTRHSCGDHREQASERRSDTHQGRTGEGCTATQGQTCKRAERLQKDRTQPAGSPVKDGAYYERRRAERAAETAAES
ncbi:MAG: hypothetical protein AB8B62_19485, partial [Roseobacter sp.]